MKLSKSLAMTAKMRPAIRPVLRPVARSGMFKTSKRSGGGSSSSGGTGGTGGTGGSGRSGSSSSSAPSWGSSSSGRSSSSGSHGSSGSDWNRNREFAFNIFADEFKRSQQCKSMVKKMVKKSVSEKWAALSEEEKEWYDKKVVQRSLEFEECYQVYLKLMQDADWEHE